jgi:hypothetical protein
MYHGNMYMYMRILHAPPDGHGAFLHCTACRSAFCVLAFIHEPEHTIRLHVRDSAWSTYYSAVATTSKRGSGDGEITEAVASGVISVLNVWGKKLASF